ncbi:DUF6058 family natural product biosynthesis protein [Massilia sp. TS11]|uniref:DUF6058 family natural product biosynthesis protein n=1 Tax=Massilia sp. TS11 TaxID=2908003 RepID=UPI001EDAA9C4|nr:DUF6058 family natural product biosynthesis protein [Massilia sp. TS11]MCG2585251.1 DUF6058 family natural product biosynthesis protein [Massilia sp. TS11]
MELLDYLYAHGLSEPALLAALGLTRPQLLALAGMPQPSYRLRISLSCMSFFGTHAAADRLAIYGRGYVGWGRALLDGANGLALFTARYRQRLAEIGGLALATPAQLASEWTHFLDGTYGLCTRSGLPEEIAEKEWAIQRLRALSASEQALTADDMQEIRHWIARLDAVSPAFAPHERSRSSRATWIDGLRARYGLGSDAL